MRCDPACNTLFDVAFRAEYTIPLQQLGNRLLHDHSPVKQICWPIHLEIRDRYIAN